jgi:anti-sigma-K factor RskA
MNNHKFTVLAATIFCLSTAALVTGQTQPQQPTTTTVTQTPTTVTKTVQHPDGTYTIIEYPVGKETIVTLDPVSLTGASGTATILRDDTGTRIRLNLKGVPKEVTTLNLYAVDANGAVTSLGPIAITDGLGSFTTTTPLNQFMLVASPEASLMAYQPETKIFFRSAVPSGFAVVPYASRGERDGGPIGERVSATTTTGNTSAASYKVPMLNIPGFRKGTDTHMKVNFSGAMTGARANIFIEPRKDGPTEVRVRFHELKEAPAGKVYVLWAVSPDNKFVKLGQIVNAPGRNEAEIRSETALTDFGLLITMEDEVSQPTGAAIGVVEIVK